MIREKEWNKEDKWGEITGLRGFVTLCFDLKDIKWIVGF